MSKKYFVDEDGYAVSKKDKPPPKLKPFEPRPFIPIKYFQSKEQLLSCGGQGHTMIFDIECYPNYFLIGFLHLESGNHLAFEIRNDDRSGFGIEAIEWLIWNFRLIGFNSAKYDVFMLLLSLRGYDTQRLKQCSNMLIGNKSMGIQGLTPFEACKEFGIRIPEIDHIDLIEVCPLSGSLKLYAARLHAKRIQELPFNHTECLDDWQMDYLANYCLGSDLPATKLILGELSEQVKLRYELSNTYKVDLRSKSDAQIAEAVFVEEIKRITKRYKVNDHTVEYGAEFQYLIPEYIQFQTPMMRRMLEKIKDAKFKTDGAGSPMWPIGLGEPERGKDGKIRWVLKLNIANTVYTMGMGGLHSNEKCAANRADENHELHDDDVESFYPWIILLQKLFPRHLTDIFLDVYKTIVEKRVSAKGASKEAKKRKDKAAEIAYKIISDSLKIVINGSFGKLGSFFSKIYAPDLMLQVTISGQLTLLMLIEMLELNGISVISANTDGIVTKVPKTLLARKEEIIKAWEKHTGFKTERANYSATYNRDINNYIAVKVKDDDGNVKLKFKGTYLNPWNDKELAIFRFHKNPRTTICIEAVEAYIINGTPIAKTICECRDVTKFIAVQNVDGGAHKDGVYLGKVARWYYAMGVKGSINRANNDNKVNETDGAKPLMDLPDEFPNDVNYEWYIEKANTILYDIGFAKKPGYSGLFDD